MFNKSVDPNDRIRANGHPSKHQLGLTYSNIFRWETTKTDTGIGIVEEKRHGTVVIIFPHNLQTNIRPIVLMIMNRRVVQHLHGTDKAVKP